MSEVADGQARSAGLTLGDLCRQLTKAELHGDPNVVAHGVQHDSRDVRPGDLFVCLVGQHADGHAYVPAAVEKGAVALIAQRDQLPSLQTSVPVLAVSDTRLALAEAAAAVYDNPSHHMRLVGVTGTNGKSTTVAMLESIARAAGLDAGRIGTLGAVANGQPLPSLHTTPEADDLQRLLATMRRMGVQVVAMEASSHGLALRRTDCTAFEVGVFTNLTQDHLDFHGTLEDYFAAKLRLFSEYPRWSPRGFTAVVNADDPRGEEVIRATQGQVITFGIQAQADLRATSVRLGAESTRFVAEGVCGRLEILLPLGGAFQVANALGAIGAALALGLNADAVASGLASMEPVPGRFEAVPTGRDWSVIVDFAHTPDGLQSLLTSARALKPRRLVLLFGCGGNRDRTKRPIMGRIAGENADVVIVTSDNPRHEDPEAIIADILEGMRDVRAEVKVEPDRRKATIQALRDAQPGDLIVLAGKGGETEMIIGDNRIPYDDREVVRAALESLP